MLDPDFAADCPYGPEAQLLDEILEIDREEGRIVATMPARDDLPLTSGQRAHPVRHPRHVSGALMVHATAILGFAHAYYVLGLRHADGWIGYGTHIHQARWPSMARMGPPLRLELRALRIRRVGGACFVRYAFRFLQGGALVYESEQSALWTRPEEPAATR
jgi:hypothetical protein